jgi:hypothetical protein
MDDLETCCRFDGVTLKPGVKIDDLETIQVDGHFVRCAAITQIKHMVLWNKESPKDSDGDSRLVLLKPKQEACQVEHPVPLFGPPAKHTPKINQGMSLFTFPINISHAITVHKLQGQTIKDLLVSSCHCPDNWTALTIGCALFSFESRLYQGCVCVTESTAT